VQLPEGGSAAVIAQKLLGEEVQVVSAFQNVSAASLVSDTAPDCDVLVTGASPDARTTVVELAKAAGFQAWHAGPLENSVAAEA
jgi:predicted dinucleotide-binding enzyme